MTTLLDYQLICLIPSMQLYSYRSTVVHERIILNTMIDELISDDYQRSQLVFIIQFFYFTFSIFFFFSVVFILCAMEIMCE